MGDVARIITTDDEGQLIELPEAYWFDAAAVRTWREGDRVMLEPADESRIAKPPLSSRSSRRA